ncbi:hypothetical protein F5Y16DRAFT_73022 [Xylariaceae sp. FL0255]|nr:hypothetical protein F5Y16DRAFT_73022 [Xylariaceae sp. FL0255]
MFWEKRRPDTASITYGVFSGALQNVNVPNLLRITDHICLEDTLDGGASPWLRDVNHGGVRPRLWKGRRDESDELAQEWPAIHSLPDSSVTTDAGEINIRCRCGGVHLVLQNPTKEFATTPRSELPQIVDPTTNKFLANNDVCDSCRLSSGIEIFNWTFIQLRNLSFGTSSQEGKGSELPKLSTEIKTSVSIQEDRDPRWGMLAFYESSHNCQRYFCSRCSACVFFACDDRPETLDIATGLLESPDGARAESLCSWNHGGPMAWRQDVMGGWREAFIKSSEASSERWRLARGYPKNWRRILKEQATATTS